MFMPFMFCGEFSLCERERAREAKQSQQSLHDIFPMLPMMIDHNPASAS